jgi:hypothetical protein
MPWIEISAFSLLQRKSRYPAALFPVDASGSQQGFGDTNLGQGKNLRLCSALVIARSQHGRNDYDHSPQHLHLSHRYNTSPSTRTTFSNKSLHQTISALAKERVCSSFSCVHPTTENQCSCFVLPWTPCLAAPPPPPSPPPPCGGK